MKKLLLPFIALAFLSCKEDPIRVDSTNNSNIRVEFLFEKDGCKVYRFLDGGRYVYYTDCVGKLQYEQTTHNGKTSRTDYYENETVR